MRLSDKGRSGSVVETSGRIMAGAALFVEVTRAMEECLAHCRNKYLNR